MTKAIPPGGNDAVGITDRNVAEIKRNQAKATPVQEKVYGLKCMLDFPRTPNPQKFAEFNVRLHRREQIKTISRIH